MDFSQEFIESNGLSEEQVAAINGHINSEIVPNIKKDYDGLANKNAEGILDGASRSVTEKFGLDLQREKGEKIADFIGRVSEAVVSSSKTQLNEKVQSYEEKIKNFKGDQAYKDQIEALSLKNDELLKSIAELEPLKGIDEKYAEATTRLTTMQKEVAYGSIKPSFPDTVNPYEAKAKWDEFRAGVEEKYNIELRDGEPFAVDKDNVHKSYPLKDILAKDESITGLLKGREQKGLNAKSVESIAVDGLPFKLPKDATSEELSSIVREEVLKDSEIKGNPLHPKFASKFSSLYAKAKSATN